MVKVLNELGQVCILFLIKAIGMYIINVLFFFVWKYDFLRQWFGRPGFNHRLRHTKDLKKMVLATSLLNTQQYKVRIKVKENSSLIADIK